MSRKIYVAYGSNLSETQMAWRCPEAKVLGEGLLIDWRLMFKGTPTRSFATIEEWENFSVPVLVWEISATDEKDLDHYEGYPKHYLKREVEVDMGGERISGMVYVKPETQPLNLPSEHYSAVLYNAYEVHGFDLEILKEALRFSDRSSRVFSATN